MARPSLTTCHVLHDLCHLVRFELDLPSQKAHWSLRHELCASSSRFQPGRRMGSTCFLNFGMLGIDCIPLMGCFETHHSQGSHLQANLLITPSRPSQWRTLHAMPLEMLCTERVSGERSLTRKWLPKSLGLFSASCAFWWGAGRSEGPKQSRGLCQPQPSPQPNPLCGARSQLEPHSHKS